MRAGLTALALAAVFCADVRAATLIYSNDLLGDIEPCGCRTNPLGGMVRKANLLRQLAEKNKATLGALPEFVQLDAGDLLFSTDVVPPLLAPQSEAQANALLEALDLLQHDAVTPGEKDFGLGVRTFQKLIRGRHLKFIAANLFKKDGTRLLNPSLILTRKNATGRPIKIGVLGLVARDLKWPSSLHAVDPVAEALKIVPALKKKCDWVIALTHEGLPADQLLAQKVPGIDLIVGAHTQSFLQTPVTVQNTSIFQSSFRNQYVGVIPLERPQGLSTGIDLSAHRLVALDANYDDSATTQPSQMGALVVKFKATIAQINSVNDAKLTSQSRAPVQNQVQTFPSCAQCHAQQFEFWRKTPHAVAFHALVQKSQAKNKECLVCHTVDFGEGKSIQSVLDLASEKSDHSSPADRISESDLDRLLVALHESKNLDEPTHLRALERSDPKKLREVLGRIDHAYTPVQCENCHGAGQNHPFGGQAQIFRAVENSKCLACHTLQQAPAWYHDGKPDLAVIAEKQKIAACPNGASTEPTSAD